MPETDVLQAAVRAVLDHLWTGSSASAHSSHGFDSGCGVCRGDVEAILTVAAPILATAPERGEETGTTPADRRRRGPRPRVACPVCGQDKVKRDDGRPISHYPPNDAPDVRKLTCSGSSRGHCRGGCRCRKCADA